MDIPKNDVQFREAGSHKRKARKSKFKRQIESISLTKLFYMLNIHIKRIAFNISELHTLQTAGKKRNN